MVWLKQFLKSDLFSRKHALSPPALQQLSARQGIAFKPAFRPLLETTAASTPENLKITGVGTTELPNVNALTRYYMNTENLWIQVQTANSPCDPSGTMILFNRINRVALDNEADLRRISGPDSPIGKPTYSFNDKTYNRIWEGESGQKTLIPFKEHIELIEDEFDVYHRAMLYSHTTTSAQRNEFLLFSIEDNTDGSISLSTSLGVSLYVSDFEYL
ncbi:DUF2491 family protein [Pseudomonas sp. NPDC098747]|uniref:DUF2491 family protein n=1 Tax=Pseudomonas sp. NPDC098747 TaxID=3364487 RepID=UPI00383A0140